MMKKGEKMKVKKVENINYLEKREKFRVKKFHSAKNTRLNFFLSKRCGLHINIKKLLVATYVAANNQLLAATYLAANSFAISCN